MQIINAISIYLVNNSNDDSRNNKQSTRIKKNDIDDDDGKLDNMFESQIIITKSTKI